MISSIDEKGEESDGFKYARDDLRRKIRFGGEPILRFAEDFVVRLLVDPKVC
jgi:hypothetical protein